MSSNYPNNDQKTSLRNKVSCFLVALFFTYEFFQFNSINTIAPKIIQTFHLDSIQLSNLSAMYLYGVVLSFIPSGLLLDRYKNKRLIVIAMLCSLIFSLLFSFSTSLIMAKFLRLLMGLGHGVAFLGCFRFVNYLFPSRKKPLMMGINISIGLAGGVLSQSPLAALTVHFGWRIALQIAFFVGVIIYLLILFGVKEIPIIKKKQKSPMIADLKAVAINPQNWLCATYSTLANVPGFVFGAVWGNIYLMTIYHVSLVQAGNVTALIFIGTILGSPLSGWLANYSQSTRKWMRIGGILSLLFIIIISLAAYLPFILIASIFFLLGLSMSTQSLSYPTIAANNRYSLNGAAMGLAATVIMGSGAISQNLFGFLMHSQNPHKGNIADYSSNVFQHALLFVIFSYLLSIVITFFIRDTCK